uniref:Cysteine protease n=1 Tax=Drosophila melanogaster TaxID=7227 RepID=Q9NBW3_DROME|nr:cysteine protease [Drosophila melanogaster]
MYLPERTEHQKIERLYDSNRVNAEPGQGLDLNEKLKPPAVYILNHEQFPQDSQLNRKGSSNDVNALRKTFESLKCRVEVISNPALPDVKNKVKEWSAKRFTQDAGFVLFILSHGDRKEKILACDHREYHLDDDVLFPLFRNPTLSGKPKILIVQACKGPLRADAKKMNNEPYIKCYSCSEGYLSYRNENHGSVFIQTLCEVMDQYGLTRDFQSIFKHVKAEVERRSTMTGSKQVPSEESHNFDKPFYFGNYAKNT